MFRGAVVPILVLSLTACGDTSTVDETRATGGGGSGASGGSQGLAGTGWGAGGTSQGGGTSGGGAPGVGGGTTKPYYLHPGRTYDHESDYIEWVGPVSFVMLKHKDQTALPADEGGAACSGGCDEKVTRIEDGGSLWGRFKGLTGINIQLASTNEAGAGQGVFSVCKTDLPAFNLATTGSGLPGFNNMPTPAHAVQPSDDCEWRVKAVGGFVYFRAVTVATPPGVGGGGGTGGTGAGGVGGIPN